MCCGLFYVQRWGCLFRVWTCQAEWGVIFIQPQQAKSSRKQLKQLKDTLEFRVLKQACVVFLDHTDELKQVNYDMFTWKLCMQVSVSIQLMCSQSKAPPPYWSVWNKDIKEVLKVTKATVSLKLPTLTCCPFLKRKHIVHFNNVSGRHSDKVTPLWSHVRSQYR